MSWKKLDERIKIVGPVIRGFGRGGKQLGFPTANLPIQCSPEMNKIDTGVYFGFGKIGDNKKIYRVVLSVGWNPQFNDLVEKSLEVHFLHEFEKDFYGEIVEIECIGFIREMSKFNSLDELITAIKSDIDIAKIALETMDSNLCVFL